MLRRKVTGRTIRKRTGAKLRALLYVRQKGGCAACGCPLEATLEVDHIDPLWRGGDNSDGNLQALCPTCHARKSRAEAKQRPRRRGKELWCPRCKATVSKHFVHRCARYVPVLNPDSFRLPVRVVLTRVQIP